MANPSGEDRDRWMAATKAQYDDDANLAARQALFNYLVEARPFPPPLGDFAVLAGKRVLDVGCGNGLFLGQVAENGAVAVGGDLSAGMLRSASASAPGAHLLVLDAEALPVVDGAFEVSLALWMLYHVPDLPLAVSELRRATARDGYVVASTNSTRETVLDQMVLDSLETVLGRPTTTLIPTLAFNAENGADILGRHFDTVETVVTGNRFRITNPEIVVRYVGSMLDAIHAENGQFDVPRLLVEVGERAEATVAEHGHVEVEQGGAVFTCR